MNTIKYSNCALIATTTYGGARQRALLHYLLSNLGLAQSIAKSGA